MMQVQTSKAVTDRQKSCQFLNTGLLTLGPRISDLLLERIRPQLEEGEPDPPFHATPSSLARLLTAQMERMVANDESVFKANARLRELRGRRDEATLRLRKMAVLLRRMVVGQYRSPHLGGLGMDTQTPGLPLPLLRQADRIVEAFAGEQLAGALGEPFQPGQEPPVATLEEMAARGEELRAVLRVIDEGIRVRDEALVARKRYLAEYDVLYTFSARAFEAFCRLAGQKELAEKVRRSTHRKKGAAEPVVDAEPGSEDPGEVEVPVGVRVAPKVVTSVVV